MKITAGAIRRYPMIFAFMALATILGIKSYLELPRESSPDVKIPFVMVTAPYAGTSPADMENLVTRKLEQRLKGVEDLKEMSSSSSYGMSVVTLEFDSRVDMSDALQSVRDRVELAKPELPEDPRDDLVVQEISSSDAFPVMQVNLFGDVDLQALKRAGEDLQEALEQIRGVLGVDLVGGVENEVQVDVDPERLAYFDLGLVDVQDAIALQNLTIPGGKLSLGQYDYQVRVRGEIEDVEEILGFVLNPGIQPPVHVREVATRRRGGKDPETKSRGNRRHAQTLGQTQWTIGISGAAARTRFATRLQKSGASMVTTLSGLAATIAAAVSRMRRSSSGSLRTTGPIPITAMSACGNSVFNPSATRTSPPTPNASTPIPLAAIARRRLAPS